MPLFGPPRGRLPFGPPSAADVNWPGCAIALGLFLLCVVWVFVYPLLKGVYP